MKRYIYSIAIGAILGSAIGMQQAYAGEHGSSGTDAMKRGADTGAPADNTAPDSTFDPIDRRGSSATDPDPGDRPQRGDIEIDRRPAGDAPVPTDRNKMVPPEGGFHPDPDDPGRPHK